MHARTWMFRLAIAIFAVGAVWTVLRFGGAPPPVRTMTVAVAQRAVEPYTVLTSDMIAAGPSLTEVEARSRGAFPLDAASGLMSTERLAPGDLITTARALPPADVRFIQDLRLEVVSFAAGLDRLVGGRVRPGHRINIYGTGRDRESRTVTELIERAALVVQVSAAGQAVADVFVAPDPDSGHTQRAPGVRERGVTMVTVALAPPRVLHLIDALSARKLEPWVTLAAAGVPAPTAAAGLPTPQPVLEGSPEFRATVVTTPVAMPSLGGGGGTPDAPRADG